MRLRLSRPLLPATALIAAVYAQMQVPLMPQIIHLSHPTLADLLTVDGSLSIFYSYARELQLSSLFSDPSANATLLVPTNKAVMALARKPHQGPSPSSLPDDISISEEEYDSISNQNVLKWVSAHIIPESVTDIQPTTYPTMLDGRSVTFKLRDDADPEAPSWARVNLEDGSTGITGMKEASNGILYIMDGTISVDAN